MINFLLTRLQKVKKPTAHAAICFYLCIITNLAHAQSSDRIIDSLQYLLSRSENDSIKIELLLSIGNEYRHSKSRMDSALYYYQKGLGIGRNMGSLNLQLNPNLRLAGLFNAIGNYPEALKLSLENLKTAEKLHNTTNIFFIKREIMWTYSGIGDNRKSLEIARELQSLVNAAFFEQSRNERFQWMVYLNLANIYQDLNQLDSSLQYRRLTYNLAKKAENEEGLALASASLAELHAIHNNIDSAFYYNKQGLFYAEKYRRYDIVPKIQMNLAYLFEKGGNLDSAMHYAYTVFNQFKNVPDSLGMTDASLLLSRLYKLRKRFDSAYLYLSLYNTLKNRSLMEEKTQKVQNISLNEMIHKRQLEQERKEARQQYEFRLKIYTLLAGLGVMILLAAILYRNNKQKHKANREIEKAYEDLKATQSQLIQSEKMASLGELTAGIAHEIQNPLNFVNNFSEVNTELIDEMQQEMDKGNIDDAKAIANDIKDNEEKINHHGKRADAIVKGMLQHSRSSSGHKRTNRYQ